MSIPRSSQRQKTKALSLKTVSRADFDYLPSIWLDVPGETEQEPVTSLEFPDYPKIAELYCLGIVDGKVPACLYIKQAAQRYLDMIEEAKKPDSKFYFSDAWACDFLDFFEKLHLPSGGKKGDKFVAQPWQILIGCAVFGFRRNDPDSPNEIGARLVREVYVEVPRGSGKALALDTPIPTPDGWTTMGEIKVGDFVYSKDGTPTKVVAATDVMFDRPCYRVTFSNGETVIADEQHLWETEARVNDVGNRVGRAMKRFTGPSLKKYRQGKSNREYWYAGLWQRQINLGRAGVDDEAIKQRFEVLAAEDLRENPIGKSPLKRIRTTKEIFESLTYGKRGDWNHSVDMPEAINGSEDHSLQIDPYLLGAWLGDGDSRGSRLTCSVDDQKHWVREISAHGYRANGSKDPTRLGFAGRNGHFTQGLRALGLLRNKHIPQCYLRLSKENRLALLQGLMDTDGHCSRDGRSQKFYNTNIRLAQGVSELLASLGVRHSFNEKRAKLNGKDCGPVYTIRFSVRAEQLQPFRLKRKADLVKTADNGKPWRNNTVQIVGCEKVESVPVRCIKVDHPSSLFLFGKTMLPTHNSPFAAVFGLYCWLNEEENGSQIFIGAPKEDQARYVYDPMKVMVETTPGLQEHYGIVTTKKVMTRSSEPMAKVRMISSIADREDGANPHVVIMEELHAQDEDLFNVMDSSLGKRINNLFFSITTAGNRAQGVCWNTRKSLIAVLAGQKTAPSTFGLIFTLDKHECEDKKLAHNPENWVKCNPMWGITLSKSNLIERFEKAKSQSPAAVLEFERTRLNIWSNGAGGLIDQQLWDDCKVEGLDINDRAGSTAWIGVDLASKNDICSLALIIDHDDTLEEITVHTEHFVPTQCPTFKHSEFGPMYDNWVKNGHMNMNRGFVTDYNEIERRIRRFCEIFDVQAIVFDAYQSNQIISNLVDDGMPAMQMQPGVKTISDPSKDLFAKIEGGLLHHDGNPVTAWMAANVVGYYDKRGNVLPQKESPNSPYRIDGIAALIAANVAREDKMLDIKRKKKSIYETRGLHGSSNDENADTRQPGPDSVEGDD